MPCLWPERFNPTWHPSNLPATSPRSGWSSWRCGSRRNEPHPAFPCRNPGRSHTHTSARPSSSPLLVVQGLHQGPGCRRPLYNDFRSWQELLLLPQCVLNAPPRGGRKHAKAAAITALGDSWPAVPPRTAVSTYARGAGGSCHQPRPGRA